MASNTLHLPNKTLTEENIYYLNCLNNNKLEGINLFKQDTKTLPSVLIDKWQKNFLLPFA